MDKNEILEEIKNRNTFQADNEIFGRILSGIESNAQEVTPDFSYPKPHILRPALILYVIIIVIASTFAVTAAVNEDVREYLISIFGGNPNSVSGELIGAAGESDGVALTVDAVVAEGDSLFMIYTLQDKEHKVFNESTSINSYKVKVGEDLNYSGTYNTILKNGEKNYMVLFSKDAKKGVQKMQFKLESLKTPDPLKEFAIPAGAINYKPQGIPCYNIDYVNLKDNRIEAAINVSDQNQYIHNYNIRVQNIKTGKTFYQERESAEYTNEKPKLIRWYSAQLDGGKAEDYKLIIPFDKVYTFEKPLTVDFSVDFSRMKTKTIYPNNAHVLTAVVEKVTVHQMIIAVDLKDTVISPNQNEQPKRITEADNAFPSEEAKDDSIIRQKMTVRYEDGEEAPLISSSASAGSQTYRFYLILNGSLDYSRKPALFIGDTKIPLN
ncbi:MAG TPA: hypothetical protein VHP38_14700 [Ruminiclostridium sp.]|nr:hypothetical protein [Ruminiclostridium sp.]